MKRGAVLVSLILPAVASLALPGCGPHKPPKFAPDVGFDRLLQAPMAALPALSDLRGHVVVLEFWATWCGPCLETLPHMNRLVETFAGQPVRFISATDEPADHVEAFLRKRPMKAWIALDPKKRASQAFGVRGIPQVFVIDPHGRIHLRITPSFLYKSDIAKALKAAPPSPRPPAPPAKQG